MLLYLYLLIPLFALYLLLGFNPLRLLRNYLSARHTSFPLLLTPSNPQHIPWTILGVPLRPHLRRYLPSSLFTRLNLTTYGFEFHEKQHVHSRLGKSFMIVTSGNNELNIADPALAHEILRRPKEFRQTLIGSHVMRIFGDNLITSDGEHWSRQRRLIASNINEKVSETVWRESRAQAQEMVEYYIEEGGKGKEGRTDEYAEGLKSVAINVLGVAGYGISRTWKDSQKKQESEPGFQLTYIEATRVAVDHIVEASLFPAWVFLLGFMPKAVKRLGYAVKEFPAHTQSMLDAERKHPSGKVNIMNMLVRESDSLAGANGEAKSAAEGGDEKRAAVRDKNRARGEDVKGAETEKEGTASKTTVGLTESEIMGNLFVFTAAGFDTTANTMAYAMTLLAANPEWQDWLCEELDEVLAGQTGEEEGKKELVYAEIYPRLVRTLAVMYETTRLFPPVVHIAKGTSPSLPANAPIILTHPITKVEHRIPANTTVYINCVAVQHDQSVYGEDTDVFRPERFVETTPTGGNSDKGANTDRGAGTGTGKASIKTFGKGTFLAWSGGPRVCPGMKMSQVEFVSVFMSIFEKYRVELVRKRVDNGEKGEREETKEEVRARVEDVMRDSQSRLTLQMNRPREVEVRFVRRAGR